MDISTEHGKKKQNRKRQALAVLFIAVFLAAAVILLLPAFPYITEPAKFRAYIDASGMVGVLVYMAMVILQVLTTVIPAGPFEFAAGFVFGVVRGTLLCDTAMLIGSSIAFFLSRRFGMRLVSIFNGSDEIQKFRNLFRDGRKQALYALLITLIPALPKDLLPYFLGMTEMRYPVFALIMFFGRIPSIVLTALFADAVLYQNKLMIVLMILFAGAIYAGSIFLLHRYQAGKPPFRSRENNAEEETDAAQGATASEPEREYAGKTGTAGKTEASGESETAGKTEASGESETAGKTETSGESETAGETETVGKSETAAESSRR